MTLIEKIQNSPVSQAYRNGWLAWLGAHKTAYDFTQNNVRKLMDSRESLVEDLIDAGKALEATAQANFSDAQDKLQTNATEFDQKVKEVGAKVFNRVKADSKDTDAKGDIAALSADIAKLTKTVAALSRKVNAAEKPAKRASAKKAVSKKTAPKAQAETPVADKAA